MPVRHCCYGDCNSDTKYEGERAYMENVVWIPFPKLKTQLEKFERWIRSCRQKYFTVDNVKKDIHACVQNILWEVKSQQRNFKPKFSKRKKATECMTLMEICITVKVTTIYQLFLSVQIIAILRQMIM